MNTLKKIKKISYKRKSERPPTNMEKILFTNNQGNTSLKCMGTTLHP